MNITVLYVGSSLLAPLRQAEREINRRFRLDLRVAAHNCSAPLNESQWPKVERDLAEADLVFVIHVTDSENAARIGSLLDRLGSRPHAVVSINCLPDLMRRTRLGKLTFGQSSNPTMPPGKPALLVHKLGSWIADYMKQHRRPSATGQYLKLIERLPAILRVVPSAGKLGDIKHYLYLFSYFLQPTPKNIRSMLLYAIKHYVPGYKKRVPVDPPEHLPAIGIYHPDAASLFDSFEAYQRWYERARGQHQRSKGAGEPGSGGAVQSAIHNRQSAIELRPWVGLLLMRPHIVSGARRHYDALIRAIEAEGLPVIPAISTFMDNREACRAFFVDHDEPRISQLVSLTGFSFVGGPAMNDSQASVAFLRELNVPFHTFVSLDMQTIESWQESQIGLNPVQTAMQVAIPEIDGATEPLIFGGMPAGGESPEPLDDRCRRIAGRLKRWHRLQTMSRTETRLALVVFCFPPNKGNVGTAADLDVFPSLWEILKRLNADGYTCEVPENADRLRQMLLGGNSETFGTTANVAYRMPVDEYREHCPYIDGIETEWGPAPGTINSFGREILILGVELGNVFIAVQPTFGYEGDPMRMLMAQNGAPHHGFMGLYTYLEKIFRADAVVHLGTHGALEFMPGKQVGLSGRCWPDRLIGELPHVYIYSVNNPSEASIAKRRSYAEVISYLTPPIEQAGLYKDLASLKELVTAYRHARSETEREHLFAAIESLAQPANMPLSL
jgi:magnesium chelatase subunit H